jgi:putative acetyltransferase
MARINVRPASREEEEACADLYESVATEGRWILAEPPVNRTGIAAHLRRLTDADDADLLVAEADGVIVGWISLTLEDAATVTLGMGVAEPWRGRGVGTALVTSAIEWAESAGAERMRLEVFTHNDRAIALYRRMGFHDEETQVGRYPRQSGEVWDALVMVRSIP